MRHATKECFYYVLARECFRAIKEEREFVPQDGHFWIVGSEWIIE